jgi:hypothetical protein
MVLLLCLLAAFAASPAHAQGPGSARLHSQVRLPGESFAEAKRRYLDRLGGLAGFPDGAAADVAVSLKDLDFSQATSWDSLGDFTAVTNAFDQVRDERFMILKDRPNFPRRISWLYPDDGCFARAALAAGRLASYHVPAPTKVFVFGDLGVKTPNAPFGSVGWWYHVVPVISFHKQIFVLDPAIDPKRPLPFMEWIGLMTPDPSTVTASICATDAYTPESSCADADPSVSKEALNDEKGYLKDEWKRLVFLKRDPVKELGDNPPWGH